MGGGYADDVKRVADKYSQVGYHGYVKPSLANKLVAEHRWALLPIDDEVAKYAFPSKSSSYLAAGCRILGVCGAQTSVARWIIDNDYGLNVEPTVSALLGVFQQIEMGEVGASSRCLTPAAPSVGGFVAQLTKLFSIS